MQVLVRARAPFVVGGGLEANLGDAGGGARLDDRRPTRAAILRARVVRPDAVWNEDALSPCRLRIQGAQLGSRRRGRAVGVRGGGAGALPRRRRLLEDEIRRIDRLFRPRPVREDGASVGRLLHRGWCRHAPRVLAVGVPVEWIETEAAVGDIDHARGGRVGVVQGERREGAQALDEILRRLQRGRGVQFMAGGVYELHA